MKKPIPKPVLIAIAMISTGLVGFAVKKLLTLTWQRTTHKEPPSDPSKSGWMRTIVWTAATGLVASFAKLFTMLGEQRIARKFGG